MSGAGAVAAVVQTVSIVLVARHSSPEVVGSYALWLAVSSMLAFLVSARADVLVLASDSEADAIKVATDSIHTAFLVSAALITATVLAAIYFGPSLGPSLAVVGALLTSRFDIYRAFLIRRGDSRRAARIVFFRSLISGVLLVLAAYWSDHFELLLLANFASFMFVLPVKSSSWQAHQFRMSACVDHLRKFKRQYSFGAPAAVVSAFYLQGLPIVFTAAFGEAVAGAVYLVIRAVQLPVGLLARATSELLTAEISKKGDQIESRRRAERFLAIIAALLIASAAISYFINFEAIAAFAFGDKWLGSGFSINSAISLMLFFSAVQFYVSPLTTDFTRYGKQSWMLLWEIGRTSMLLLGVLALRSLGADAAFLYWTTVALLSYVILHALRKRILRY